MFLLVLYPHPYFEAEYCLFCGRRRVAVAGYRMICLVLQKLRRPLLGREGPYFVKEHSDSKNKCTEDDMINMLEFLVDNIFVVFGGKIFIKSAFQWVQMVPLS